MHLAAHQSTDRGTTGGMMVVVLHHCPESPVGSLCHDVRCSRLDEPCATQEVQQPALMLDGRFERG